MGLERERKFKNSASDASRVKLQPQGECEDMEFGCMGIVAETLADRYIERCICIEWLANRER